MIKASSIIRLCIALLISLISNNIYAACGFSYNNNDDDRDIISGSKGVINIYIPVSYVPRDAPIGSIIGTSRVKDFWDWGGNATMFCTTRSTSTFTANGITEIVKGITVPSGSPQRLGPIFKTNIPGVGVIIETETFGSSWTKTGNYPYVPYRLVVSGGNSPSWTSFSVYVSLVKIGDIPTGTTQFTNMQIVSFEGDKANLWKYRLNGSVVQTQCSIPQSAKSINVKMGAVQRNQFHGKNTFLDAHAFEIPLTDCINGTYPTNQSWNFYTTPSINIKLDGLSGSYFVDQQQGILGLSEGSTASGVAVQILYKDGINPVPLGRDIPFSFLTNGAMTLSLKARYIQTSEGATGPSPGSADAKAAFTITYK